MSVVAFGSPIVRIRILRVPPSTHLEGFDLRPFDFREGHVYELGRALATILVVWGYAEPDMRREDRDRAAGDKRRRD